MDSVSCSECKAALDETTKREPCPRRGSTKPRTYLVTLESRMKAYVSLGDKVKNPALKSDQKLRSQGFSGYEYSNYLGKMVRKSRLIDRDRDLYFERITDIETGEVLNETSEPLSQHRGHGSAKVKPKSGT
jgi:hypothetical protein